MPSQAAQQYGLHCIYLLLRNDVSQTVPPLRRSHVNNIPDSKPSKLKEHLGLRIFFRRKKRNRWNARDLMHQRRHTDPCLPLVFADRDENSFGHFFPDVLNDFLHLSPMMRAVNANACSINTCAFFD